jgi:hypothetical protein
MKTHVIVTMPSGRPGLFVAMCGNTQLCDATRQPFLDGCRELLRNGAAGSDLAVLRHAGSSTDSLRSAVSVAARVTTEETGSGPPRFRAFRSAPSRWEGSSNIALNGVACPSEAA